MPLDLNSYKFIDGEYSANGNVQGRTGIVFSGPVQMDERESENFVSFDVRTDHTLIRFYVEYDGVVLTLE